MRTPARRRWSDYSRGTRLGIGVAGVVQVGLLGAAWADLGRRDAAEVNGPRWAWVLVSLVNVVGPLLYFAVGRRAGPVRGPGRSMRPADRGR